MPHSHTSILICILRLPPHLICSSHPFPFSVVSLPIHSLCRLSTYKEGSEEEKGLRKREKGMGQPTRVNGSQAACLRGSSQADPCSGRPMKISSPEAGDNSMGRMRRRRRERERRMTQGQSAHCPCHSISPPPTPTHAHTDLHAPKLPLPSIPLSISRPLPYYLRANPATAMILPCIPRGTPPTSLASPCFHLLAFVYLSCWLWLWLRPLLLLLSEAKERTTAMVDPVIPEQLLLSSDHTDGVVVLVLVPMSHHQLLMKLPRPSSSSSYIRFVCLSIWMYVVTAMGLPEIAITTDPATDRQRIYLRSVPEADT